jgi:selenocysteine lyase/cysteine desulfurase
MMKLDIDFVRQQFPAFEQPSLRDQAFFESAGGSYTCRQVIDRLTRYYTQRKIQPYYPNATSQQAGAEMDEARARLATFVGVETDELCFGPSSSQNVYVLAQSFRQHLNKGDAIIVTNQDHEANSGPWRRLADDGIEVREWLIDPQTGSLHIEQLAGLLDEAVKLVCFPHCSNVIAEINPVAEIVAMAHAVGAYSCVDGVSYAPHGLPDIGQLGADIYLFSAYKTWGPHQGVMAVRRELGKVLPNQAHYFNAEPLYKKFVPAGPDHAQVAACAGMVDYFETLHAHHFDSVISASPMAVALKSLFAEYEAALLQPLLDYIEQRQSLRLIGPGSASARAATVSFLTEAPSNVVTTRLAALGIMCGAGHYYGIRALKGMGIDPDHGVVRVSFVHYTSQAEVDRLIDALEQIL